MEASRTLLLAVMAGLVAAALAVALSHYARSGGGPLADKTLEGLVEGSPETLRVRVDSLDPGESIPVEYTCDGPDRPPRVSISGVPGPGTIVLIVYDPDAPRGTFIHWLAYHKVSGTSDRTMFPGPEDVYGRNSFGAIGYGGPCPPRGERHRYFFLAIYTSKNLDLPPGYTLDSLVSALRGNVDAWGYIYLTYQRP